MPTGRYQQPHRFVVDTCPYNPDWGPAVVTPVTKQTRLQSGTEKWNPPLCVLVGRLYKWKHIKYSTQKTPCKLNGLTAEVFLFLHNLFKIYVKEVTLMSWIEWVVLLHNNFLIRNVNS